MNIAKQILEKIYASKYILVVTHINPDADTISSALAISNFFKLKNIKHKVYNIDKSKIPRKLNFLPLFDKIVDKIPDFFDLIIYVDSADERRTGVFIPEGIESINIDHHQSNEGFATYNIIKDNKSSTAEVVFEFLEDNDIKIDKQIATCLYTGIYDDSIAFTTPRVDSKTFKILNELLATGIDIGEISDLLLRRESLAKYRIMPKILDTLTLYCEGKLATVYLDKKWLDQTGAQIWECDDIVNDVLNISIVQVVAYLRIINGKVRVSLRSKGEIDVSLIAQNFNGGGHKNAAGLSIDTLDIFDAVQVLESSIKNYI